MESRINNLLRNDNYSFAVFKLQLSSLSAQAHVKYVVNNGELYHMVLQQSPEAQHLQYQ